MSHDRSAASQRITFALMGQIKDGPESSAFGLIRNAGIEPTTIEYLKAPPDRKTLLDLIKRMRIRVRELLRHKGTPYDELGLDEALNRNRLMALNFCINRQDISYDRHEPYQRAYGSNWRGRRPCRHRRSDRRERIKLTKADSGEGR